MGHLLAFIKVELIVCVLAKNKQKYRYDPFKMPPRHPKCLVFLVSAVSPVEDLCGVTGCVFVDVPGLSEVE